MLTASLRFVVQVDLGFGSHAHSGFSSTQGDKRAQTNYSRQTSTPRKDEHNTTNILQTYNEYNEHSGCHNECHNETRPRPPPTAEVPDV